MTSTPYKIQENFNYVMNFQNLKGHNSVETIIIRQKPQWRSLKMLFFLFFNRKKIDTLELRGNVGLLDLLKVSLISRLKERRYEHVNLKLTSWRTHGLLSVWRKVYGHTWLEVTTSASTDRNTHGLSRNLI